MKIYAVAEVGGNTRTRLASYMAFDYAGFDGTKVVPSKCFLDMDGAQKHLKELQSIYDRGLYCPEDCKPVLGIIELDLDVTPIQD
jgi:hypothetical protein